MKLKIPEDFLCYIWKFQLIDRPMISTDQKNITVKFPGIRNLDAGPDFSNSILQIEGTTWAGNIEVHYKSSDWYHHKHHLDKKYESVILHVVYEDDKSVIHRDGSAIPTLVLKDNFQQRIFENYEYFMQNQQWIACENQIQKVDNFKKLHFLSRLTVERLERKTAMMNQKLLKNKNDFEQLLYLQLASCFGFKTNTNGFEMLAHTLPFRIVQKHRNNLLEIEALLFGQAGMLDIGYKDEYPKILKKEYYYLRNKYELRSIPGHIWKYLRLRPVNFPTIRISQFARLLHQNESFFSKIIESDKIDQLEKLFELQASAYWDTHYRFDKIAEYREKTLGKSTIQLILINVVAPILFVYGKHIDDARLQQQALHLLSQVKGESNSTIVKFQKLGFETRSAFFTQAMMELKTQYCDFKKCLDCEFGVELLGKRNN